MSRYSLVAVEVPGMVGMGAEATVKLKGAGLVRKISWLCAGEGGQVGEAPRVINGCDVINWAHSCGGSRLKGRRAGSMARVVGGKMMCAG